jgi:hypothetical protein
MGSLRDRAEAGASQPAARTHPQGWEPGIAWDGQTGSITAGPFDTEPDPAIWAELVKDWGLDPTYTAVVPGSVQVRGWDAAIGGGEVRRMRYYRATLQAREDVAVRADVDKLCATIRSRRPRQPAAPVGTDRALVVPLADWQIGKGEGGGTPASVARINDAIDAIADRLRDLRKLGKPVDTVYLIGMGDITEACVGHYPSQTFTVDLDRRSQLTVARDLIDRAVDVVSAKAARVVVGAVPGNHGENRTGGKAYTTITDNDDLAVFEQVAYACSKNPDRYGHVSFVLADGYVQTFDIAGVPVGFTHGYKTGSGGNAQAKQEEWWRGQALGDQLVADVQILVTAHYHHFSCSEATGRFWLQCPAMDGGSTWWTSMTGQSSMTGTLSFLAGKDCGPRGWSDIALLGQP